MLSNPVLEARARALSQELRCMVCQNESIDESHAPLAHDLRVLVRERLQAGDSDAQVLNFLVARYGEFVLLKPRLSWHTAALWGLLDKTRLGAMIRAAVDDPAMARVCGIRVSHLFTIVFSLGAGLAGFAGVIGGPILSVYPGLDQDMLPLALVVVILGGSGSLLGSLVGSFVVGFLYNFGQAMFPELAYVILFLPMLIVLVIRPRGLFGRVTL